ncbi:hypothetical protein FF011L_04340 [Roseimaritima multifibrata]|uniref:Uncharacterized protein n=1 Tax=Roseimaritima multifibrata TaxID=1930274 RepID=A0A517MA32_9BACT|nr:hypothetical protein FF011L_04340 [Roseimaritima multifibrata]
MSAVGNKILKFNGVAGFTAAEGISFLQWMLVGRMLFLIANGPGQLSLGNRKIETAADPLADRIEATIDVDRNFAH